MRADLYLFSNGYTKSRNAARGLIESGSVTLDGKILTKPSAEIDDTIPHETVLNRTERFVSRGGLKLEAALIEFNINVHGLSALDIGASTGGFTDCLLTYGVSSVVAVDSGEGQLDSGILKDPRVKSIEKYNARTLSRDIIPDGADIVVIDVSFISQTIILPCIPSVFKHGGKLISLIKPQFEAGRTAVGKGGIVKSQKDRLVAVLRVRDSAASIGLKMTGFMASPIAGGDGNIEFLALFETEGSAVTDSEIKRKVTER